MLRIIAAVGIGIVVIVAAILVFATTRPDTFRVQRSTSIKAPPEKVVALIDDFGRWGAWSPWEKKDPAMKRTLSSPAKGKGAVYAWDGNGDVGKGRMEIAEATPSKVTLKLDFVQPFEAHNIVEFTTEPKGDATALTWAMHGPMPYVSKVISIFCDMDAMIGKDFEAGLASLKTVAER